MEHSPISCVPKRHIAAVALLLLVSFLQPSSGSDRSSGTPDFAGNPQGGSAGVQPTCAGLLRAVIEDSVLARRVLVLERPGDTLTFTMAELAASPLCVEGRGGFTTSAGTEVTGTWAGISLPDLLTQWAGLQGSQSLTFVADDGYRMAFDGSEILDRRQGTWILAMVRDGAPIPAAMGPVRAIKVGRATPMVTGHLSVQGISRIRVSGVSTPSFSLAMRGSMNVDVDRQTLQSCVSCHGACVNGGLGSDSAEYDGVPLYRLLAFSDDSLYAPHRQDSAVLSYQRQLAAAGYGVEVRSATGETITLDSRVLDRSNHVILALYRGGNDLTDDEAPVLVAGPEQPAAPVRVIPRVTSVTLQAP